LRLATVAYGRDDGGDPAILLYGQCALPVLNRLMDPEFADMSRVGKDQAP
jgi:hypothetical protein